MKGYYVAEWTEDADWAQEYDMLIFTRPEQKSL